MAAFAVNAEMMFAARALQGFGAAAPRIIAIAIVRDRFAGRSMARVDVLRDDDLHYRPDRRAPYRSGRHAICALALDLSGVAPGVHCDAALGLAAAA